MNANEEKVLLAHDRYVAHMRAQIDQGRFGLVLGAGVSKPLFFPNWGELVDRIAKHPEVRDEHILASAGKNLPETSKAQMLFQHYRSKKLDTAAEPLTAKIERQIQGQWRRIIHAALYENVTEDPKQLKAGPATSRPCGGKPATRRIKKLFICSGALRAVAVEATILGLIVSSPIFNVFAIAVNWSFSGATAVMRAEA